MQDIKVDGAEMEFKLEDFEYEDEDYFNFRHRAETIKKNLTKMAVVHYDQEDHKRQNVIHDIDRALDNEEKHYRHARKSIRKLHRISTKKL